jgi:hypothetical protein
MECAVATNPCRAVDMDLSKIASCSIFPTIGVALER